MKQKWRAELFLLFEMMSFMIAQYFGQLSASSTALDDSFTYNLRHMILKVINAFLRAVSYLRHIRSQMSHSELEGIYGDGA